jgi:hypothetical protein
MSLWWRALPTCHHDFIIAGHRRPARGGMEEAGGRRRPRYGLAARLAQPVHPRAAPGAALGLAQRGDIE